MQPKIRNILIDVNGCLQGPTPVELHEALPELWRLIQLTNGGSLLMGACSGRELPYIRGVLHLLGSPNGWSIYESGLGIFHVQSETWIENPRITTEIRQVFQQELSARVRRILSRYPGMVRPYKGNELHVALEMTAKATFSVEQFAERVQEELQDLLSQGLVVLHHSTDTVDLTTPGIDKGAGVLQVQDVTGILKEETLGIGDTNGDIPMLSLVGFVGCPANSSASCKALVGNKGGFVSQYSHAHAKGVVDCINHFLEAAT